MGFARSDALFPPAELRAVIASEFEKQCRVLCFGPFPNWEEVERAWRRYEVGCDLRGRSR